MWNLAHVIEPNGAETHFHYNQLNRLETIEKADKSTIQYEYDANGNRTGVTDEAGNETRFVYDALNQLIEVRGTEGLQLRYTYDHEGRVISVTCGGIKESETDDADEDGLKGAGELNHTIYYTYDNNDQLIQETNPLGDSRSYTYTSLGKIATITDEAGLVTTYHYEKGGRLKTIVHPGNIKESYTYDKVGNIKTHTIPIGLIQEYIYDSLNRVIKVKGSNGEAKSYTYDAVSNVTSMTDELGNTTCYEYSLTGKLTSVTDALGNLAIYTYDERDQLIEVKQLGSEILTADQDLEQIIKQNAENQTLHITKYERDMMGRVTTITDALGQQESFKYSVKGQLIEKLDKDGYLTKYDYTTHGDVSNIQYADGKEVKMRYNVLRQLTEVNDWLGTTKIMVDALGRATRITNHQDKTIDYTWGVNGEKRSLTYPDGNTVSYEYDELLRLNQVDDGKNKVSYHYDEYSRLVEKAFQNGVRASYQYDMVGRLAELSHWKRGTHEELLDKFTYEYDIAGNKTKVIKERKDFPVDTGTFAYSYDSLNRLHEVVKDGSILRTYHYDGYGNRTTLQADNKTTGYTYNSLNQLMSSVDNQEGQKSHQTYSYDKRGNLIEIFKNHQLTHQYHFGALNSLESVYNHEKQLGATYQYNGLGHRVGKTEGKAIEPVLPTTNLNKLDLNPTKQVDDVIDLTRRYHNLLVRNENKDQTSFTWDFGVLSAHHADENVHNYLLDDLGSLSRVVNGMDDTQELYGFDEFGINLHSNSETPTQPFAYTGYQTDDISGSYYAQTRQYNPQVGRFISQDTHWNPNNMIYGDRQNRIIPNPLALGQSSNLYGYTLNNPVRFTDPSGLFAIPAGLLFGPGSLLGPINPINSIIASINTAANVARNNAPAVANCSGSGSSSNTSSTSGATPTPQNFSTSGGGVTVTRDGNNVSIVAYFYFRTPGRLFNQNRIPNSTWSGTESSVTYAEAFLQGVRRYWGGTFGNYTVTMDARTATRARDGITVDILSEYGVSNRSGGWSIRNRGTITMFQGDNRSTPNHRYTFDEFLWVSAHEFGHALGLFDVVGVDSIMSSFGTRTTELDIQMILEAAYTRRRPAWR